MPWDFFAPIPWPLSRTISFAIPGLMAANNSTRMMPPSLPKAYLTLFVTSSTVLAGPEPLALWDVWTAIAGPPVAFESPSAGFALDWRMLNAMRARGIGFATVTHAAGISSTGDDALDALLPFDEPYDIPAATESALARARVQGGRIVAVGTTVVRALEHAAARDGSVHAGAGLANQRIGPSTRLQVADAILSGVHEPGTSHYQLLGAFAAADDIPVFEKAAGGGVVHLVVRVGRPRG